VYVMDRDTVAFDAGEVIDKRERTWRKGGEEI
jgi:hypothetical protein